MFNRDTKIEACLRYALLPVVGRITIYAKKPCQFHLYSMFKSFVCIALMTKKKMYKERCSFEILYVL